MGLYRGHFTLVFSSAERFSHSHVTMPAFKIYLMALLVTFTSTPATASSCPASLIQVSNDYNRVVCQDVSKWLMNSTFPDTVTGKLEIHVNGSASYSFDFHLESQDLDEAKYYYNYSKGEVMSSASDILGLHILKNLKPNTDPRYTDIRAGIPPIQKIAGTFEFTGSRFASVDVSFGNNGEDTAGLGFPTPEMFFDSSGFKAYYGHVDHYLPIVTFMFTKPGEAWQFDYVPEPEPKVKNQREQSVYFRALHVTAGINPHDPPAVKVVFNDTYAYYGSYRNYKKYEQDFYDNIIAQRIYWEKTLYSGTYLSYLSTSTETGKTLYKQTLHSIVKDMITRRDFYFPSYGVYPGYGIPGNNGFQEIITVSLPVSLEWGLFDYAKGVLLNYLDFYMLPSGNVRYRGLEMAQVGRMLTQFAMYYRYTGDDFFLDHLDKINGSITILNSRYESSLRLAPSDPAYGLVTGNDEADLWSVTVGGGYTEYPFYSMSAETVRAFTDLGSVFIEVGKQRLHPNLTDLGKRMLTTASHMMISLRRSLDKARHSTGDGLHCLPYAAGTNTCTNIPMASSIRVSEPWRTYSEMMYSGVLSGQDVDDIVTFSRYRNSSMKLGVLSGTGGDCCGPQLMTFTSHGFAWGLLQHDRVTDFLMMLYSVSNHALSRGLWTAPESTNIDRNQESVAYCSPSQGIVPLMFKWMIVFEDPETETVWIGKAIPRDFIENGQSLNVTNATVSYGSISFYYVSHITNHKLISVSVIPKLRKFPNNGVKLRTRAPGKLHIKKVVLNGKDFTDFNATGEYVNLPSKNTLMTFNIYY